MLALRARNLVGALAANRAGQTGHQPLLARRSSVYPVLFRTAMCAARAAEPVSFMTVEEGDDLIVSFAIDHDSPGEVVSVILMRTPKYEHLLEEHERGANVSHELHPESDEDRLRRVSFRGDLVDIEGTSGTYLLDVSRVDAAELRMARRVLQRMNYDGRFQLDFE